MQRTTRAEKYARSWCVLPVVSWVNVFLCLFHCVILFLFSLPFPIAVAVADDLVLVAFRIP